MVYNAKKDDYTWKPHTDLVKSRGEIPDVKRAEAFAEAYGVQDYVSKPFAIDLLINVIDDVMVKYKKPDEQDEDEQLI
jgi:response regulator RpfG family c-di-GMP phosphodiesterase